MASLVGKKDNHDIPLRIKVAEELRALAPAVEEEVVRRLTHAELNRQATMVVSAFDFLEKMEKEKRKLDQFDDVRYDSEKKKVEGYSAKRIEDQDKHRQKMEKFVEALNLAIGGDFKKLEEQLRNLQQSSGKDKGGGGEKSEGSSD